MDDSVAVPERPPELDLGGFAPVIRTMYVDVSDLRLRWAWGADRRAKGDDEDAATEGRRSVSASISGKAVLEDDSIQLIGHRESRTRRFTFSLTAILDTLGSDRFTCL